MFTDLFGGAPHARVFDYLVEELDRDHTITEITRGSGVARPTVYKVIDDLVEQGVVEQTRTVGNSRFFQLDRSDRRVRGLVHVAKPTEFVDIELPGSAPATGRRRSVRRQGHRQ